MKISVKMQNVVQSPLGAAIEEILYVYDLQCYQLAKTLCNSVINGFDATECWYIWNLVEHPIK